MSSLDFLSSFDGIELNTTWQDKPCHVVKGRLRNYAVEIDTRNVFDLETGKRFCLSDSQGSHTAISTKEEAMVTLLLMLKADYLRVHECSSLLDTLYDMKSALLLAILSCDSPNFEEEGGVIVSEKSTVLEVNTFIKLKNANTGTDIAPVLWTADPHEFAKKVIPKISRGGRLAASFHTHPRFAAQPSQVDLSQLFLGFKDNYIYSPTQNELTHWQADKNDPTLFNYIESYRLVNLESGTATLEQFSNPCLHLSSRKSRSLEPAGSARTLSHNSSTLA